MVTFSIFGIFLNVRMYLFYLFAIWLYSLSLVLDVVL